VPPESRGSRAVGSGIRSQRAEPGEFCQEHGLSLATLARYSEGWQTQDSPRSEPLGGGEGVAGRPMQEDGGQTRLAVALPRRPSD